MIRDEAVERIDDRFAAEVERLQIEADAAYSHGRSDERAWRQKRAGSPARGRQVTPKCGARLVILTPDQG